MKIQLHLPYDIWEAIASILGDEMEEMRTSTMSLRALSQSCKSMVPLCRKHLFSTLILTDDAQRSGRFRILISNNPSLISYVQRLKYRLDKEYGVNCAILDVLKNHSSVLRHISIFSPRNAHICQLQWDTLSVSLQNTLKQLFRLPTITELQLLGIKRIPSTLFANSANLSKITLQRVDFLVADARPRSTFKPIYLHGDEDSYDAIYSLMQLRGPNKDWSVVDFSRLAYATFDIEHTEDTEVIWKVLQVASVIESLSLRTVHPLLWKGLGDALSTHATHTLRKLEISIMVDDENNNPLSDLVSELKRTAGLQRLEEITLDVAFNTDILCQPTTHDWSDFDALVTTPGPFPLLKLVRVEILWAVFGNDEKRTMESIQEAKFPNLQRHKTVEFRFSAEYELI